MRSVKEVEKRAATFYRNNYTEWLAGNFMPLPISLHPPKAREVESDGGATFRSWKQSWENHWITVEHVDKRLGLFGIYSVPSRVVIDSPSTAARLAGLTRDWERTVSLLDRLTAGLAEDSSRAILAHKASVWAGWSDITADQFIAVVQWLRGHDTSDYYQRELPIMGVDTKWLETHAGLVSAIAGRPNFKPRPIMVEIKSLDPALPIAGDLRHLSADVEDLSGVPLGFDKVVIVENYTTFIALPELPRTLAVYGGGFSVTERIDFIGGGYPTWYWSDLDSAGFAMLASVRAHLPQVHSILMDTDTVLSHLPFAVEESQSTTVNIHMLTADERATYELLCERANGSCLRIEQERIGFAWAVDKLRTACVGGTPR